MFKGHLLLFFCKLSIHVSSKVSIRLSVIFPPALSWCGWHVTLCNFKAYNTMIWHTHVLQMTITVRVVSAPIASQDYLVVVVVVRAFKIDLGHKWKLVTKFWRFHFVITLESINLSPTLCPYPDPITSCLGGHHSPPGPCLCSIQTISMQQSPEGLSRLQSGHSPPQPLTFLLLIVFGFISYSHPLLLRSWYSQPNWTACDFPRGSLSLCGACACAITPPGAPAPRLLFPSRPQHRWHLLQDAISPLR